MRKLFPLFLTAATLGTLTACGAPGTPFGNPFSVPFDLTLEPSSVTLTPGNQTHVSVTARAEDTILPSPTIKAFGNSIVTATPDDTGFTVAVAPTAQPGTYSFNVSASVRGGEGSAPFTVTVTKPSDTNTYDFKFQPETANIEQGQALATTLQLRVNNKVVTPEAVVLDTPAGITASYTQNGVIVSVDGSTVPGLYTVIAQTQTNGQPLQAVLTVEVTKKQTTQGEVQ